MRRGFVFLAVFLAIPVAVLTGCSLRQTTRIDLYERAERIAAAIERAESKGARDCSPRELARAKVALEHVLHELEEGYYPPSWTELHFEEAERLARTLLDERILAEASGTRFRCYRPEG